MFSIEIFLALKKQFKTPGYFVNYYMGLDVA